MATSHGAHQLGVLLASPLRVATREASTHWGTIGSSSFVLHQSWRLLARAAVVGQHGASRGSLAQLLQLQSLRSAAQQGSERFKVSVRDQWSRFEAQVSALWTGLALSPEGQKLLIGALPVAVVAQLFPTRFQALARDLHPGVDVCTSQESHLRHVQRMLEQQQRQQERSAFGMLAAHALSLLAVPMALLSALHGEMLLWLRGAYLALLFTPALASGPVALWAGGAARQAWLNLMCWTLERAGPAFIKWGQWSSTRPDLFPPDLCQAMERLQTAAPAHDGAHTRRAVLKALGRPPEALFDSFEDLPVASGSIAQIHRATLSKEGAAATGGRYKQGATVAVKVRHPGVTTLMQHDFELMQRAARLASRLPGLQQLRLEESIRQFGGPLKEQLDLAVEASHLARFKHNFRLWRNISFPTPIYPLVSSDVLVESFESGSLISRYVNDRSVRGQALRGALAEAGLTCYLQMLLADNFIHADLHPGNILVRVPGDSTPEEDAQRGGLVWRLATGWLPAWLRPQLVAPPKLVLLDTGMIAELSRADQGHLINFFKALTRQDGEKLGHAILDMSERYTCKDPDAFVHHMKSMFDALDPEHIHRNTAAVIESIIDTIRQHQVTLRSAVSTVVVTTLVLEGWSTKLNPEMRILDHVRDMLMVDWNERISLTVDKIMRNGSLAVV